jgi:transposase-like protein
MKCWGSVAKQLYRGIPHHDRRKVERPSHEQLLADLESMSYCAVGRKYGVSDNAVRKWLRWYEREQERKEGGDDLSLAA